MNNELTNLNFPNSCKKWEDFVVENVNVEDLDASSFKVFRRNSLKSKRMTKKELNISDQDLLDELGLTDEGKLKRSAILLFHENPSILRNGCYVKIGKFETGSKLLFHDLLEGSLIRTAEVLEDLIFYKYLEPKDKNYHDEVYPYSKKAVMEAVYYALAHNCYSWGVPIQIRVDPGQIIISYQNQTSCFKASPNNDEELVSYNPEIANALYLAGFLSNRGSGIEIINKECSDLGYEPPKIEKLGTGTRIFFQSLF